MRTIGIMIVCFFCLVNNSCNTKKAAYNKGNYTVMKIDSINGWYMIYANKGDSIFKIVSKKNNMKHCEDISVGKTYNFILHSKRENPPKIGNVVIIPHNYLDVQCFSFDNETVICIEPEKGIYDLYRCENLTGICY